MFPLKVVLIPRTLVVPNPTTSGRAPTTKILGLSIASVIVSPI